MPTQGTMAERHDACYSLAQWKHWGRSKSKLATNIARENGALKERIRLLIATLNVLAEEKVQNRTGADDTQHVNKPVGACWAWMNPHGLVVYRIVP